MTSPKGFTLQDLDTIEGRVRHHAENMEPVTFIAFPEGTMSATGSLQRFKIGTAYLASKLGCQVQPNPGPGCQPSRRQIAEASGLLQMQAVHVKRAVSVGCGCGHALVAVQKGLESEASVVQCASAGWLLRASVPHT